MVRLVNISEKACVDMSYMSRLTGKTDVYKRQAFVLFNLLREVFEQLVLQTILLALVVGFHQLQAGYLHICLLYTSCLCCA